VAERPDKICVITDIGLDHMNILGTTISEITGQKAGIIHNGNIAFMHRQSDEIMRVIRNQSEKKSAKLCIIETSSLANEVVVELPIFQRRNFTLAYEVYEYVRQRDNLP